MSSADIQTRPGAVHRLKDDVHWRNIDGEIVALDMGQGRYISINPSAATLWPMLGTGATSQALVARLVEVYGLPDDVAENDVEQWLRWLGEEQLLAA